MSNENDRPNPDVVSEQADQIPAQLNILQRIIGVFGSPQKTFEDIAARPNWVFPLILLVLVALLTTQIMAPAMIADFKSGEQYEKLMQNEQLTPEQIERAAEMQISAMKNFAGIGAAVSTLIICLLAGAVLLFIGNIILGGEAKYVQIFSMYCWGGLIGVLGSILRLPLAVQKMSTKIYFGPAVLFPAGAEESAGFKIAAALDIFLIWRVVLLAVGFAAIYKFTFGKSITALCVLYALLVAISIVFSGVF